MANCVIVIERRVPDVTCPGHPQWRENQLPAQRVQPLPGDLLDNHLQIPDSLTGIAEIRSWIKEETDLAIRIDEPRVRPAGLVAEHQACGNALTALIAGDVAIRRVFG